MKKLIHSYIIGVMALAMMLAPILSEAQMAKPQEPPAGQENKCKAKVQVVAQGVTPSGEYIVTLLGKSIIKIAEEQQSLQFTFNFNSKSKAPATTIEGICPGAGSELTGDINGQEFPIVIKDQNKPTRVTVQAPSVAIPEPEPLPPTNGNTTEPEPEPVPPGNTTEPIPPGPIPIPTDPGTNTTEPVPEPLPPVNDTPKPEPLPPVNDTEPVPAPEPAPPEPAPPADNTTGGTFLDQLFN